MRQELLVPRTAMDLVDRLAAEYMTDSVTEYLRRACDPRDPPTINGIPVEGTPLGARIAGIEVTGGLGIRIRDALRTIEEE